jgi:H/ACA ribonucleoprotein complex non-core subunit NAF1
MGSSQSNPLEAVANMGDGAQDGNQISEKCEKVESESSSDQVQSESESESEDDILDSEDERLLSELRGIRGDTLQSQARRNNSNSNNDNSNEHSRVAGNRELDAIPRTANELKELPPVDKVIDVVLNENDKLVALGRIAQVMALSCYVVVQSDVGSRPLDLDNVLFLAADNSVLGRVDETFGPVKRACYTVRFNCADDIDLERVCAGAPVAYAPRLCKFALPEELKRAAPPSDASTEHDEEPAEHELDYSDDETERINRKRRGKMRLEERRRKRQRQQRQEQEEQDVKKKDATVEDALVQDEPQNDEEISLPPPCPTQDDII